MARTPVFQKKGGMNDALHAALAKETSGDKPSGFKPGVKGVNPFAKKPAAAITIAIGGKPHESEQAVPSGDAECPKCGCVFNPDTQEVDEKASAYDKKEDVDTGEEEEG